MELAAAGDGFPMLLETVLLVALAALLASAACTDLSARRIPNGIVASVGLLWLPFALTLPLPTAGLALGLAMAVLLVGMGAWSAGWFGAGDAKLLAALSLWAGPAHLLPLLLTIAVSGGVLAIAMLLARRLHAVMPVAFDTAWIGTGRDPASISLPYGLAIAAGGLWLVGVKLAS
jgi:prepilin peptidase CpaA